MTVDGSYLRRIEVGAAGGGQRDLHGALAVYGGSAAYADQVLASPSRGRIPRRGFVLSPGSHVSALVGELGMGQARLWTSRHGNRPCHRPARLARASARDIRPASSRSALVSI
jgi:hypothetical protein